MQDRFVGTLLGSAVGDALGGPVEFKTAAQTREQFASSGGEINEMVGGGRFMLLPGEYTDDTAMTLCIAESLVAKKQYDAQDIARRFVAWYKTDPKDIGGTTRQALAKLSAGVHYTDSGVKEGKANGSLMRCAPLSLYFVNHDFMLVEASKEISAITHAHAEAKMSCVFINLMISQMVRGAPRPHAYQFALEMTNGQDSEFVQKYLVGSFYEPDPAKGLAVNTLLLSLSCLMNASSFEEAVVRAVNLGGDADTTGAVAGALAGAYFGAKQIPWRWTEKLNPQPAGHFVKLGKALFRMAAR